MVLMVRTAKGLMRWWAQDRRPFQALPPALTGEAVYQSVYDPESGTPYAAVAVDFTAPSVRRPHDVGATWDEAGPGQRYGEVDPERTSRVWFWPVGRTPVGRRWTGSHSGAHRPDVGGNTWGAREAGLPSDFRVPLVLQPRDPDRAFVIPLASYMERGFPGQQAVVYGTDDGGRLWRGLAEELPGRAFSGVSPEAFAGDAEALPGPYFGTTSGSVNASADEGEVWTPVAQELPRVLSVTVVAL